MHEGERFGGRLSKTLFPTERGDGPRQYQEEQGHVENGRREAACQSQVRRGAPRRGKQ